MAAVAISGWAEFIIRIHAEVTPLVNVNDKVITLKTNSVDDVLIDDGNEFLDSVLRHTFVDDERAVDHTVGEV